LSVFHKNSLPQHPDMVTNIAQNHTAATPLLKILPPLAGKRKLLHYVWEGYQS